VEDARAVESWRKDFIAQYEDVQRNLEDAPQAENQIAHVHFLAGDFAGARAKLEETLEREPGSARAHNNLAVCYAAAGNLNQSLEHLEAARAGDPSDAGVWLN